MPVPTTAVKMERRLLRDGAYDAIRAAILDGSFSPGEVLEDGALQEWLGMSRTPVRDALLILAHEGLIDTRAQSSTRVASLADEDIAEHLEAVGRIVASIHRITLPAVSDERRHTVIALAALALSAAHRRDFAGHRDASLRLDRELISLCPNAVLVKIARDAMTTLGFRAQGAFSLGESEWENLVARWTTFIEGTRTRDDEPAARALEAIHLLPKAPLHS